MVLVKRLVAEIIKCPKCNLLCLLEDVRPLRITSLRIPLGSKDIRETLSVNRTWFLKFHKHETGRRNFALIQGSRARMWLNEVLRRVKVSSRMKVYNKLKHGK
ncbi:hypothetical protein Tco_0175357 [Tanacetum coccineum]